jgi:hypothetical protein
LPKATLVWCHTDSLLNIKRARLNVYPRENYIHLSLNLHFNYNVILKL